MEIKKKVTQSITIEKMERNEKSQQWHVNLRVEMPININGKSYSDLKLIFHKPTTCFYGILKFSGNDQSYTIEEVLKADPTLFCFFDFCYATCRDYLMRLINNHMTINKFPSVDYIKDPSNYYYRIDEFDNRIIKDLSFNFNFWEKCMNSHYEFATEDEGVYTLSMRFQNQPIYGISDVFFAENQLISLAGIKLIRNDINRLWACIRNAKLDTYDEIPFVFDNYPILQLLMTEDEFYNTISESFNDWYIEEERDDTENDK